MLTHVMALRCVIFTCSRSYISDSKSESYVRCCVVSHKFSAAISAESDQTPPPDGEGFSVFCQTDWSVLTVWCEQLVCECEIAV